MERAFAITLEQLFGMRGIRSLDVQVSSKPPQSAGFTPLPIRWRIEATFGTQTNRYRRLTRNLEQDTVAAEDAVQIAAFNRVLRVYSREVEPPA